MTESLIKLSAEIKLNHQAPNTLHVLFYGTFKYPQLLNVNKTDQHKYNWYKVKAPQDVQ